MPTKTPAVTELDFGQIKEGLRDYLEGQDRFKDYNFEGANLSVLLDILSYNTFQNNFYTNMAISEMFLDSAQLRDSIVSHAKELNYLPRSRVSSKAVIDVVLDVGDNPSFVTIPEKTKFTAKYANKTFDFFNENAATVFPSGGVYKYRGLEIHEGIYVNESFTVQEGTKFVISNDNIDLNSVRVTVKTNDFVDEYLYAADLYGLNATDKAFFIQPYIGDRYEVFFGKNVFGTEPEIGSVVKVDYRITAGEEANGITSFSAPELIAGYEPSLILRSASRGGAEKEDLKSIKYYAPKAIQIQERAVTAQDFKVLLKRRFPEIKSIAVYGGERMVPPQYGRVIISIDIDGLDGLGTLNKETYRLYLKDRASVSIEPIIRNAEFMYYEVNSTVRYNTKTTDKSSSSIRQLVYNSILKYSLDNLEDFQKNLRFTRLSAAIDDSDENIVSNETSIRGIIEISPATGVFEKYILRFGNKLLAREPISSSSPQQNQEKFPVAVKSTLFVYNGYNSFMRDNGRGKLQIITRDENRTDVLLEDIGTVNYETGEVSIDHLNVESYQGEYIKVYANAFEKDFTSPIERITKIRGEDIKINVVGVREE